MMGNNTVCTGSVMDDPPFSKTCLCKYPRKQKFLRDFFNEVLSSVVSYTCSLINMLVSRDLFTFLSDPI
jgi:hypothetical protein